MKIGSIGNSAVLLMASWRHAPGFFVIFKPDRGSAPLAHLVVINGPAGVGKTTISRHLAGIYPGTINVSGDALLFFGPPDVRKYLGAGSTYRAAASLITSYLEMG